MIQDFDEQKINFDKLAFLTLHTMNCYDNIAPIYPTVLILINKKIRIYLYT